MNRLAVVLLALAAVPAALSSHGARRDQSPTWSPDGTNIAFSAGGIWAANVDGTGHRRLGAFGTQPAWSPDGRRIAFTAMRESWDIHVKDLQSGNETRVTTHPSQDYAPAWSPDGSRIAFYRFDEATRRGAIVVAQADGSGEAVLATEGNNHMPQWSPDGTRIVFQSERDGNWEIYVMQADGTGQRRLTVSPDRDDGEPAWSPDGRIVFSSGRASIRDIYVMNADGSGEQQLTNLRRAVWGPRFSPDGTRIAFFEFPPGRIYIANADGSGVRRLFVPLAVASLSATPKRPVAGGTFALVLRVSGPSDGAKTTCRASAGRALRLVRRGFVGGAGRCTWLVPARARGKLLFATVVVTAESGRVTRNFSAVVR